MTPAEKILQKSLVTSGLDSAQWNQVQAGIRDRAFFSSRVESARFLHSARTQIAELAAGERSASEIQRDLRKLLDAEGYTAAPGDEGTIKDLRSTARLNVLIETNARQARGYVRQIEGTTPGALAASPGQELIRFRKSMAERDWSARWRSAGGKLYGGRMVALKGDPVWLKLSRFGVPWPPFDFGSGMGVVGLPKAECIELGLVRELDPPPQPPAVPGFNSSLEAEVPFAGKDNPEWNWLQESFGDQIIQKEGKIRWMNDVIRDAVNSPSDDNRSFISLGKAQRDLLAKSPEHIRDALAGRQISLQPSWIKHLYDKGHIGTVQDDPLNLKLLPGDFDLIPSMWRNPDAVLPGDSENEAVLELETFDGGTLRLVLGRLGSGPRPLTFYKKKRP